MELYCRCGYPILVAAHWTGEDVELRLHDGWKGKESEALRRCPGCGSELHPGDLERLPPIEQGHPTPETGHVGADAATGPVG